VTLKLVCDDGTTAVGDATPHGREVAVEAYLREHVCPMLIGREAGATEDTWRYLYNGAYWRRGPVTMTAIAAVDCALWDIKGKQAGMPVYELLGGRCRTGITVYAHANGETVEEVLEAVQSYVDLGYRAVLVQAGISGLEA
jgi:mannonate dehydratase